MNMMFLFYLFFPELLPKLTNPTTSFDTLSPTNFTIRIPLTRYEEILERETKYEEIVLS